MTSPLPPGLFDPEVGSEAEARAAFLLRLRAKGVRDIAVLRAMEAVPRAFFVAHRYADLASRDVALPIGCGQTMAEPAFVAAALQALGCAAHHRVLDVGCGSGYLTALLSRLAGEIVALERFKTLAEEAAARLETLDIGNASVLWADGLAPHPEIGTFDRIVLLAAVERPPEALLARLAPHGRFVYPAMRDDGGARVQALMLVSSDETGALREQFLRPARLQAACPGRSAVL